jgi:hypothetical protein
MSTDSGVLDELLETARVAHLGWINGDSSMYEFSDERSTIMGAFGGATIGATAATPGQRVAVGQFQSGSGTVELINGGVSGDTAWLVMLERAMVTFTDADSPARWDLRVTEVFERRDSDWVLVHRHADPLVDRHSLHEVLGLLS